MRLAAIDVSRTEEKKVSCMIFLMDIQ
jgi:hypothetical protein